MIWINFILFLFSGPLFFFLFVGLTILIINKLGVFFFDNDDVLCGIFCRSLFVVLYFFIWPLCCLFFFDILILITPLVSSNSSLYYISWLRTIVTLLAHWNARTCHYSLKLVCLGKKHILSISQSFIWPDRGTNPRSYTLMTSTIIVNTTETDPVMA